jgi:hypothetical protein
MLSVTREGEVKRRKTDVAEAGGPEKSARVVEELWMRESDSLRKGREGERRAHRVPSRELLTEEDDGGGKDATKVLRRGEDGAETTHDGRVRLLQGDRDFSRELDGLQLERDLILRRFGVNPLQSLASALEVAHEDVEPRSLGQPVHSNALRECERNGEGEDDAPTVVDVLETSGNGVSEKLTTGDHAAEEKRVSVRKGEHGKEGGVVKAREERQEKKRSDMRKSGIERG